MLKIRVWIRSDGKTDIIIQKSRPGECTLVHHLGLDKDDVGDALAAAVQEMRAGTKFGILERSLQAP